jgi:hypothetical protein
MTEINEAEDDEDAESASENIGDVADGVVRTNAWNSTSWVDANWGGRWVGRGADKDKRCIASVLKLIQICKWKSGQKGNGERTSR